MKRLLLVIGFVAAALSSVSVAQAPASPGWKQPRTPDGRPDLQGTWTTQTFTPLQRPKRYAGREFLTEEEAAELIKLLAQDGVDPLATNIFAASDEERRTRVQQNDPTHYNNAEWLATAQPKTLSSRRTSLIFDPPDGLLPPLTPEGQKRAAARRAAAGFDSYETRPAQERCIVWTHEGPPMMPPPYNDVLQIMQTPGYVIVYRELATAPRIIPTDNRPHLPDPVRTWTGHSIGRWEGDTLVVDTTNFNDKATIQGSSSGLHVIERFTRVSADRIQYQVTLEDPGTWTRPWSAEIPMLATEGRLYEYACHEGNYGLAHILSGARYADREAGRDTAAPGGQPRF
jgi:hypothetical protein